MTVLNKEVTANYCLLYTSAILADLKEGGFLKEIEPLKHEVGTCYRCHSAIEPMVSKQWFRCV